MNNLIEYINKKIEVEIDRPLGSKHPKHNFIYCLNHGFIPNTIAPDGEEIDAYVIGVFEPIEKFTGKCIAIIHRLDDDDDKLVVCPEDKNYSDEQILALTEFQERFFKATIIR